MQRSEKIIYVILGVVGILQLTNVIMVNKSQKTIEQVKEKVQDIEPIKQEIKQLREEVEIIKGQLYQSDTKMVKLTSKEKECLLRNIFFEAGVEDVKGKIAVAQVTLNRVYTNRWGSNVCDVVYANKQFSWTLSHSKVKSAPKGDLWLQSKEALKMFIAGNRIKGLEDSLHYHTDYIKKPKWSLKKEEIIQIGRHIFYHN